MTVIDNEASLRSHPEQFWIETTVSSMALCEVSTSLKDGHYAPISKENTRRSVRSYKPPAHDQCIG
jgi:hypothetical protein